MPDINFLAVLVAAIASMIIGSIWFGPLFGKTFMEGVGMNQWSVEKKQAMKKKMVWTYLQQFVLSLLIADVFAHLAWGMDLAMGRQANFMSGLSTGLWIWLGFALPIRYGQSLWSGKEFKYTAIDLGYWLVLLLTFGVIFSAWQ